MEIDELTLERLPPDALEQVLRWLQPKYRAKLHKSGRSVYDVVLGASSKLTNNVNVIENNDEFIVGFKSDEIIFKFKLGSIPADITKFLEAMNTNKNFTLKLPLYDYLDVQYNDNVIQISNNVVDAQNTIRMFQIVNKNIVHTSILDSKSSIAIELEYDARMDRILFKIINIIDGISISGNRSASINYVVLKYEMLSSSWILALEELEAAAIQHAIENVE
jgi:hypothetical protein